VLGEGDKAQDAIDNARKLIARQLDQPSAQEREIALKVREYDEDIPF